ncbi:hypothetical protein ACS0TY_013858 [Phlomoides rotata]
MINPMKLSKIVTKWKRRGHFVMYSKDNHRFIVPLCYLNHPIFRVLLEMAEEYGLTVDGPLCIPCEKEFVDFILCLLRRNGDEEVLLCGKGREKGDMQSPVLSLT